MNYDKELIKNISQKNKEPEWLLSKRIAAFENINKAKVKESRRLDYSHFVLDNYEFNENGILEEIDKIVERKISSYIFSETKSSSLVFNEVKSFKNFKNDKVYVNDLKSVLIDNPSILEKYYLTNNLFSEYDQYELFNQSYWTNGYLIYIPTNVELEIPIHNLLFLKSDGSIKFLNNFIIVEEGSKITVIDSQISSPITDKASLVNNMLNVIIGNNATLNYISIQELDDYTNMINRKRFLLNQNSYTNWVEVIFGGRATQNNNEARLTKPGSEIYMSGLYFASRNQQMEFNTRQLHLAHHTKSDLLYSGAILDNAKTSYEGLIRVDKSAQKTDAYQKNKNLLLSKNAHADSEPLLEIEANDVRCTHGATVGPINPDDLFYLMSRGIERDRAKKLLISGFFSDLIEKIPNVKIQEAIRNYIEEKV